MTLLALTALVIMLVLKIFKIGQPDAKKSVKPLVVNSLPVMFGFQDLCVLCSDMCACDHKIHECARRHVVRHELNVAQSLNYLKLE